MLLNAYFRVKSTYWAIFVLLTAYFRVKSTPEGFFVLLMQSVRGWDGLEFQPADGFVPVPVGELALGVVAGVALD